MPCAERSMGSQHPNLSPLSLLQRLPLQIEDAVLERAQQVLKEVDLQQDARSRRDVGRWSCLLAPPCRQAVDERLGHQLLDLRLPCEQLGDKLPVPLWKECMPDVCEQSHRWDFGFQGGRPRQNPRELCHVSGCLSPPGARRQSCPPGCSLPLWHSLAPPPDQQSA